jgi:hypothetical protein
VNTGLAFDRGVRERVLASDFAAFPDGWDWSLFHLAQTGQIPDCQLGPAVRHPAPPRAAPRRPAPPRAAPRRPAPPRAAPRSRWPQRGCTFFCPVPWLTTPPNQVARVRNVGTEGATVAADGDAFLQDQLAYAQARARARALTVPVATSLLLHLPRQSA